MGLRIIALLLLFGLARPCAVAQVVGQPGAQPPKRISRAFLSDLTSPSHRITAEELPQPDVKMKASDLAKSSAPLPVDNKQNGQKSKNGAKAKNGGESAGTSEADRKLLEQGRVAFENSCTDCHEASRSLEASKTLDGWMKTIREMAAKEGANVRPADYNAIARYLTANAKESAGKGQNGADGEKDQGKEESKAFDQAEVSAGRTAFNSYCLKCHDAERSTSKSKSYSEWLDTVRRMAAKDGAGIPSSSYTSIATYLASLTSSSKESGASASLESGGWSFGTTVSTLHRSASDESFLENPGFFADVWTTASYQSSGAWGATVTACTSCHSTNSAINFYGLELMEGSATVNIRKLLTKCDDECGIQLSLKAGRFPVPFGAFSTMSHPGVYRTVTVPLMFNMGRRVFANGAAPPRQPVLPQPFSDEGFDFIFKVPLTQNIKLGVDVYAVNGLQGAESTMFDASRAYADNNEEPFFGMRTTLGGKYLTVGASLLHGGLQNQRQPTIDCTLWGADATSQLTERLRIYGEFARRRQDSTNLPDTAEKTFGVLGEVEYQFFKKPYLSMLMRYDTLEHRSMSLGDTHIQRLTSGFNIGMPRGSLLMINHELWQPETGRDVDVIGVRWSVSL